LLNANARNFGDPMHLLRAEERGVWIHGRPEMAKFLGLIKNTKGATAIEYGLIAALIAVAAIAAMQSVGNKLNTTFNNVSNNLG
jgi:pilus assembly protein Flp/PilA